MQSFSLRESRDLERPLEVAVPQRGFGLVVVREARLGDRPAFAHDPAYFFSVRLGDTDLRPQPMARERTGEFGSSMAKNLTALLTVRFLAKCSK